VFLITNIPAQIPSDYFVIIVITSICKVKRKFGRQITGVGQTGQAEGTKD
jgi:hypothetical protein